MKRRILSLKTILHSMIATLLVLTLLVGFIVVEKNTRKIGFADSKPWIVYKDDAEDGHYIKIRFMDECYTLDFSGLYVVTDFITETMEQGRIALKIIAENVQK